jgi:hypothetical protein
MVPEHLRKQVLVCRGSRSGHSSGNHLAPPTSHSQLRFVGEMAAEVRPVDQSSFRVGATHESLVGRCGLARWRGAPFGI